jgi:hypothetical protein
MLPFMLQSLLCMPIYGSNWFTPFLHLQTRKGQPAKRQTSDEFKDRVQDIKEASEKSKEEHPQYFSKGGPYYSWDNASFHTSMNLEEVGTCTSDMWELPPNSPDMHKVIEHVVGRVKMALRNALCDNAKLTTVNKLKHECKRVFFEITAESVQKDIDSLPNTYKHIHTKQKQGGREGDWALARYR